jgi:hypothetical protein
MPQTPKLVLDGEAVEALLALPSAQRRRLLADLESLRQDHPQATEDFSLTDDSGRHISVKALRPVLVAYWLDSPVDELRIIRITRAKPQAR